MSDLIPTELTFTTVAAAIAVLLAIKAFITGVLRQIWGMLCLAGGCVAGYFIFQNGNEWLGKVIDHPSGNLVLGTSIAGGTAVWLGGKGLVHKIYKGITDSGGKERTMTGRLVGAVVSLAPTSVLVWVIATVLRLSGSLSEMSHIDSAVRATDGTPAQEVGMVAKLRRELDQGWLGDVLKKTDPFTTEAGHQLASLLVLYKDADAWARLKHSHPDIAKLLDNEKVRRALNDKQVRNSVAFGEHASLLVEPEIVEAAKDPEVARQLMYLDIPATAKMSSTNPHPKQKQSPQHQRTQRTATIAAACCEEFQVADGSEFALLFVDVIEIQVDVAGFLVVAVLFEDGAGDVAEGGFAGGFEDDGAGFAGIECLLPAGGADAPAVAGFESEETVFGTWGA